MGLKQTFYCTFVYGANDPNMREQLWREIIVLNRNIKDPWLLIGDFNCILHLDERIGSPVIGVAMHKVCSKLKALKYDLKKMNRQHCPEVEQTWRQAEQKLSKCQQNLHSNPNDMEFKKKESEAREKARATKNLYIKFLKQRAKISWLRDGDSNTALFHRAIRVRKYQNSIYQVMNKQAAR
ncbi:ATP synthase subunit b chloroplastic [Bienertia sinuspersici]